MSKKRLILLFAAILIWSFNFIGIGFWIRDLTGPKPITIYREVIAISINDNGWTEVGGLTGGIFIPQSKSEKPPWIHYETFLLVPAAEEE